MASMLLTSETEGSSCPEGNKNSSFFLLTMDRQIDGYTSVDIEVAATSLKTELGNLHASLTTECCIYRVPKRLQYQSNERDPTSQIVSIALFHDGREELKATQQMMNRKYQQTHKDYAPQVVSIGPLHHGRDDLKPMEEMKRMYLKKFLSRTSSKVSMEDFLGVIEKNEEKIRKCYAETIEVDSDNFVKMILVDAAFVIEVFLGHHFFEVSNRGDRLYDRPWLIIDVNRDLWLLENQLPFFILKDLFDEAQLHSEKNERLCLVKIIYEFCKYYWDFFGIEENFIEIKNYEVQHLVDFLRKCVLRSELKGEPRPKTLTTPSVTELHQAGVKLKKGESKNFFDIKFENGVLEIPQIRIRGPMEILLKNLLAFERCHCYGSSISDYVVLLSYLVDTPKDVDLLVQKGIIEHRLRNNEAVSTLFHTFTGHRLDREYFCFASLVEKLNKYCENPWHKWQASLKQDYFNTPWASVSVIAAVILLILTVIQSVCSVLQVI